MLKFHYDNTPAGSFVLLVSVKFCIAVVRDLAGCWGVDGKGSTSFDVLAFLNGRAGA
ncbi:MAG: hypothetical protein LW628_14810 [Fimbriimonadaceae bacterium]|nr:hypothetical protein [Fimbriimonadaceae bacterium]